ncbi:MAG TPA: 3-methyl-2-oxobutanoate hydroxymethyltransferase [bacterium]|nr:3-methyl-2-oxobutanoate hydroxymethyltransferase [bacterium]
MKKGVVLAAFVLMLITFSCENNTKNNEDSENSENDEDVSTENDNWEKQWGSGTIDEAKSIAVDSSDSVYVLGNTLGSFYGEWLGGYFDIFLVKFDRDGNELWGKQWVTICGEDARAVAVDSLNHVVITGLVCADNNKDRIMFVAKFDQTGKELWTKKVENYYANYPHSVAIDKEDNIFVAGYDGSMMTLYKFDHDGNELWKKQFGTFDTWNVGRAVGVDSKGNAFVTGTKDGDNEEGSYGFMFLAKFNEDGDQLWVKTIDRGGIGISLTVDNSDNVVLIGENDYDAWLTKFDNEGNKIWEITQKADYKDSYASLYADKSGNIIVAGSSVNRKPLIVKYNDAGKELRKKEFGLDNKQRGAFDLISIGNSENIYLVGWAEAGLFGEDTVAKGLKNAVALMKAGAEAVKVEGGKEVAKLISTLTSYGIPVVGHVGLTPQYVNKFGGFGKRGKTPEERKFIFDSAIAVEKAGAEMIVLESIPETLAEEITKALKIPTIGIGAGKNTDGQVLVIYDLLGMDENFNPSFLKKQCNLDEIITNALKNYKSETEI